MNLKCNEVVPAQLAVDTKIEERELPNTHLHLQADTQCPDVLGLERWLLADSFHPGQTSRKKASRAGTLRRQLSFPPEGDSICP